MLPNDVDRQECLVVSRAVYPIVKRTHDFEERELFPYLRTTVRFGNLNDSLDRLRFEHWEDEAYAEEICDVLGRIGRGGSLAQADKLSWMLRGFFEGARRHIAFESEHPILPFRIEDVEMNDDLYYCVAARHWLRFMLESGIDVCPVEVPDPSGRSGHDLRFDRPAPGEFPRFHLPPQSHREMYGDQQTHHTDHGKNRLAFEQIQRITVK